MVKEKAVKKSLDAGGINEMSIEEKLALINEHTIKPLAAEDVYTFDVRLCDNEVDRVGDKMTSQFLEQFAEKSKHLTGLKDHDWESDNQVSRLYDAVVITDTNATNSLGEPYQYVLGRAYTLSKYTDYIEKINAGLLKEVSVSFESVGDTCSICGKPTCKTNGDRAVCEDGHMALEEYDGVVCHNLLNELNDTFEWSLVAVPCQRNSGIKNKSKGLGGIGIMKKKAFMLQRLLNSKSVKADEETQEILKDIEGVEDDADLSEDDIKSLIAENAKLKEMVSELEAKVAEAEGGRTKDRISAAVEKAVDNLNPLTPTVKENIMRDIDIDGLELGDEGVVGLDDIMKSIEEKYAGLFKAVEAQSEKEEGKDDVEDKAEEEEKTSKSYKKHNSGISFGVNGAVTKSATQVKSGRRFE